MTTRSLNSFLSRQYDSHSYHCGHFVCDVWEHITGKEISNHLRTILLPEGIRYMTYDMRHYFKRINKPITPSIVIMSRLRHEPHTGVFIDSKVIHLTRKGAVFQPFDVATFGYTRIRFYTHAK